MSNVFLSKYELAPSIIKLLESLHCHKVFLVRGHSSFEACGAGSALSNIYHEYEVIEYSDFANNPRIEDVEIGRALLTESSAEVIIAVGGGSAIDVAKLIRFYDGRHLPLIACPTTSGTGAEATQFAVCYIDGVKKSISDPSILPDYAFVVPEFTYNNSKYLTACTGFDALAQAYEAYWNVNSTPESDKLALEAISHIQVQLIRLVNDELDNIELRKSLSKGSNLAGQAINITRTTAPHAMSYTLTSKYGYPHGHAVALTFPFFYELNLNARKEDYVGENYQEYKNKVENLQRIDMKAYVHNLGLGYDPQRPFINKVVEEGINLERAKNNPARLSSDIILLAVESIR